MYDNYNNDDERSAGDVIFSFKRKWDNYWYHYKWYTLIGIATLIFLVVCITQCASQCVKRTQSDANIAYVGSKELRGPIFLTIINDFNAILNEGIEDDDEAKVIDFQDYFYLTPVEIENARAAGDIVDTQSLMTIRKQIDLEIMSGSSVIYFLSAGAYREFSQIDGMFMPIEEALGYIPESAADNYSIRLSALACREYFEGIYNFPENTVIAVRNYQTLKKPSDKELARYESNFQMLKKIIEFVPPVMQEIDFE